MNYVSLQLMCRSATTGNFITVWMNVGSNTKRAGITPTRLCKFNRFYPANKTFCKDTTNFKFCQVIFNKFLKYE